MGSAMSEQLMQKVEFMGGPWDGEVKLWTELTPEIKIPLFQVPGKYTVDKKVSKPTSPLVCHVYELGKYDKDEPQADFSTQVTAYLYRGYNY